MSKCPYTKELTLRLPFVKDMKYLDEKLQQKGPENGWRDRLVGIQIGGKISLHPSEWVDWLFTSWMAGLFHVHMDGWIGWHPGEWMFIDTQVDE